MCSSFQAGRETDRECPLLNVQDRTNARFCPFSRRAHAFSSADIAPGGFMDFLRRWMPILYWLPRYSIEDDLPSDILCGVTVKDDGERKAGR